MNFDFPGYDCFVIPFILTETFIYFDRKSCEHTVEINRGLIQN